MVRPRPAASTLRRVHHIGATVADLDRALASWEPLLGVSARWRRILDAPYLGEHVGYPGIRIDAAVLDLPGGGALELLHYWTVTRRPTTPAQLIPATSTFACWLTTSA